jgi:hypothetical protein
MRSIIVVLVLLASLSVNAETVNLDFEEQTFSNFSDGPVVSKGYLLSTSASGWGSFGGSDSERSQFYCSGCSATMEQIEGNSFTLNSLELSSYGFFTEDRSITLTGFYTGGGSVSTVLTATTDPDNWTAYNFGSDWQNLQSLGFGALIGEPSYGQSIGFDNVVVSSVPVPAAVWLFGSALAGLGWMRRKQTV